MTQSRQMAHELDRVVRKIDAQMHKQLPQKDSRRIGPMGVLLLMQLETLQPCPIQALANLLGRDNSQLTRLIRDLEQKGVLERKPHEKDKRVSLLQLTESGQEFLEDAKGTLTVIVDQVIDPLTASERTTLLNILNKL
ncbi:MAG: MarR family transcriptional regulator [Pseudomonadota bacterium]